MRPNRKSASDRGKDYSSYNLRILDEEGRNSGMSPALYASPGPAILGLEELWNSAVYTQVRIR